MPTFMDIMVERAQKRRLRAITLRRAGLTYEEIGRVMGMSRQAVGQLMAKARKKGEL